MFHLGQQAGKDSPTCKYQLMNHPHIFQAHVDPSVTSINYFPFFPLINNFMLVQKLHLFPIPAMSSSKGPRFVNLNLSSLSVYQLHCACRCHGPLTYHIQSINGGPFTRHHNHIPLTRRFRHQCRCSVLCVSKLITGANCFPGFGGSGISSIFTLIFFQVAAAHQLTFFFIRSQIIKQKDRAWWWGYKTLKPLNLYGFFYIIAG